MILWLKTEEVDSDEIARIRFIDEILVHAEKGGLPKPPMNKDPAEKDMMEGLYNIGVSVKGMKTLSDNKGNFEQSQI